MISIPRKGKNMKIGQIIHGFEFISSRPLPELQGTLHEAVYKKNGAKLLFIDREDSNKTFAIAFKTIPTDDTGVFHIIEHSVLCGSEKYPVKEPFVELLKGSLKTFLNAFTFPDKTMYPVSSRNEKDFLNLVDIYMDAVLHPIAITKPEIFYQEGWHYELHSKGEDMLYKGVVFNEMKGAYSSADELEMSEMGAILYKGSCYGMDSGGDPLAIPSLTYEQFVASHAKYYHPSNSRIILDGSVELEKTLALLDSFLCNYDYLEVDSDIPMLPPMGHTEKYLDYEISENEAPDGKARVCLGFASGSFAERKKITALSIIIDAISGSNEAPFKKAMLDLGICEDTGFIPYDGIQQNSILLEIKNVKEENMKRAEEAAMNALRDIAKNGIDKALLTASFNSFEFRIREQDSAGFPAGISYAISALDTWLYGGDPIDGLSYESDLSFLRSMLDTDYYEKLLEQTFLNSPHSATLYMIPSSSLGEKRVSEEKSKLAAAKSAMTDSQLDEIIATTEKLENWQKTPDTAEALSTIPRLEISDISELPEQYPTQKYEIFDTPVLYTSVASRKITYAKLLFDMRDFTEEELALASLLTELYKNLATDKNDAVSLQTKIKTELGSFAPTVLVSAKGGKVCPYFHVSISALTRNLASAVEIADEVLLHTLFEDSVAIGKIIRQIKVGSAEAIASSGHSVAFGRAGAYVSAEAATLEYIDGVENYLFMKRLDENYANEAATLANKLTALSSKIFTRSRLTVFHAADERCDSFVEKLISVFPEGTAPEHECGIQPFGMRKEGIIIPAQIAFASQAGNLFNYEERLHGSMAVIRSLLSFGFLWNAIRVQGGAYGAGFIRRNTGVSGFYTYRDPDANRSIEYFAKSSDFLREIANSGEDITNFIIGAIGDSDPLITPKTLGALALASYLRGETYEDRIAFRREMLSTSKVDLLRAADLIDKITKGGVCVVGGKDKLLACGDKLDSFIEI